MRPLALISNSKHLLIALVAATVIAVVGTTVGYASLSRQMTLSLDGQSESIHTMSGTVSQVLEGEGIEIGEHDIVAPGLDEEVADGARITVRFGRPLELTVDGQQQTHWVHSTNVADALAEIGRRYLGADLSASRGASIDRTGMKLTVVTPKNLTIKVGKADKVKKQIAGETVADVLEALGASVDKDDIVKPKRDALVEDDMTITVTKVRRTSKSVDGEVVPFRTIKQSDSSMYEDETETVKAGKNGLRDVTYRLVFHNGDLVAKKVVTQKVLREPVDAIVKVGTKERVVAANFAGGSTVWDRLAQCESGGNWALNTGNGYYGGIQFSASTWHSVGGTGLPHEHSREEQIKRGQILQSRAGWGQWPHCSAQLGLR
ncbi:ubiquitin-like domain-containing protein [Nocardioides sp.]|uniref:ubiquitin-like domain-containing protein n=1 Tax=Nocardioides sp. TaxID=35761 RepID=UPI002BED2097|nr:transglycosylase family protein [Nocardioides sp.]HSX67701.1 transglycosylase family protein [Nocardioides sp.]